MHAVDLLSTIIKRYPILPVSTMTDIEAGEAETSEGGVSIPPLVHSGSRLMTAEDTTGKAVPSEAPGADAPIPAPHVKERRWSSYSESTSFYLGDIANALSFLIMVVGILLTKLDGDTLAAKYILGFGLFGFAGGLTNWLAVKMLFDRIPGLIGSGVIPRQFKEIREAVKDAVLEMFFDSSFLKEYLGTRSKQMIASMNFPRMFKDTVSSPDFDEIFLTKLTELSMKPEGLLLNTISQMFGGMNGLAPMLKPMLIAFGEELITTVVDRFDPFALISVDKIRDEISLLMTEKLQFLTPEKVKEILEHVIRRHLGWLVVWGNVFGGLIGVVAIAAGYGG